MNQPNRENILEILDEKNTLLYQSTSAQFFGMLIIIASYAFLILYTVWILLEDMPFLVQLPSNMLGLFPSKIYRTILPSSLAVVLICYYSFNWICMKLQKQKVEFLQQVKSVNQQGNLRRQTVIKHQESKKQT